MSHQQVIAAAKDVGNNTHEIHNLKRLEGKVAIITGGASGIGASAAELFVRNGAKVVIADIQDQIGQAMSEKFGKDRMVYIHCDVSNEEDVINLIDTTVSKFGKLDVMYNNAGVTDAMRGGILDTTTSNLQKVINVNIIGSFLGAKHAARVMVPERRGCILFTASAASVIAGMSTHAYAASKHAVVGLAKNLAAELGKFGIRVNCISPSGVATNIMSLPVEMVKEFLVAMSPCMNLQGPILESKDVANAALFLASDEASYVSGLNLVVDGGYSIVNPSMGNTVDELLKDFGMGGDF